MPKLNLDEIKATFEPVEFTYNGKDYTVNVFAGGRFERVNRIQREFDAANEAEPGSYPLERLHAEQMAVIADAPPEDFLGIDVRLYRAVMDFVGEAAQVAAAESAARQG